MKTEEPVILSKQKGDCLSIKHNAEQATERSSRDFVLTSLARLS